MDRTKHTPRSRLLRLGTVLVIASVGLLVGVTPAYAAAPTLTLDKTQGPSGGGNTLQITTPTTTPTFTGNVFVQFQFVGTTAIPTTITSALPASASSGCWPTWVTAPGTPASSLTATALAAALNVVNVPAAKIVKYSVNKLYVTVPTSSDTAALTLLTSTTGLQTSAKYNVCVYSGNTTASGAGAGGSPLIAQSGTASQYTISAAATVLGVTPASGPAKGGTQIIVTGTNFTTGLTATLGGVPLTINSISTLGDSFTATTAAHAGSTTAVLLSVATTGGTVTLPSAFTYSNGVYVAPDNAPRETAAAGTYVEVSGVGFLGLNVTGTNTDGTHPDAVGAHVYLTQGAYDRSIYGTVGTGVTGQKKSREMSECINVLITSDTLLLCKMTLTPLTRTVEDATVTGTSIVSNTARFSQNDVGMSISSGTATNGPGVLTTTIITAVISPTKATLSAAAATDGAVDETTIGNTRTFTTATSVGNTLTATGAGNFTSADVGRAITGTGLAAGTTITSVTSLDVAQLSITPTSAVVSGTTLTVTNALPDGAYTLVVVSDGTQSSTVDPNFTQSVISSGATFTVGEFTHNK